MNENDISKQVIGMAIDVHKALGPGLLENAYQECLNFKLIRAGLIVEKQKPMPLIFDGVDLECGYRMDLLVENRVVVEVKSVEALNNHGVYF